MHQVEEERHQVEEEELRQVEEEELHFQVLEEVLHHQVLVEERHQVLVEGLHHQVGEELPLQELSPEELLLEEERDVQVVRGAQNLVDPKILPLFHLDMILVCR